MEKKNITGKRIRKARTLKNMLLVDVVAELNVDHYIKMDTSALGRLKRGQRSVMTYELHALIKILEMQWTVF